MSRNVPIFAVLKMTVRYEKMPPYKGGIVVSAIEQSPIRAVTASGNGNVPVACTVSQSNAKCCPIFDTSV